MASACGALEGADRGLKRRRLLGVPRAVERDLKFVGLIGRAVADQPLPHRLQRGAADLTRAAREIAIDQERFQRAEHQTRRIVGARSRRLVGPAHDLAQFLEHERGDGSVFATLDGALELTHQQRLRLRRKLCEILSQPLVRCLTHAPGCTSISRERQMRPLIIIKAPALRSRLGTDRRQRRLLPALVTALTGISHPRQHQFRAQPSDRRVAERKAAAIQGGEVDHDRQPKPGTRLRTHPAAGRGARPARARPPKARARRHRR